MIPGNDAIGRWALAQMPVLPAVVLGAGTGSFALTGQPVISGLVAAGSFFVSGGVAVLTPSGVVPSDSGFFPDRWEKRTAADYVDGWNDLLPTGPAWPREPDTDLQTVVAGQAQIWGDEVESLAALLLTTESDPRLTNILLPEWERAFGLPDDCLPFSPTDLPTRRQNLVAKMTFLGAQSRAFFADQAADYGQIASIREYSPYQCGISGCGDTRNIEPDGLNSYRWGLGPAEMRFVWTMAVTGLTGAWAGTDLFCVMNRWKPAHTQVITDYSALQELRASRPWNSGYYGAL